MSLLPAAPVGWFAPSPTGPLHFGSIVAAVGSYLSARHGGGRWLLRIEDVDVPRSVPGAADGILRTLERFGFEWDGPVVWQSARTPAYEEAFARLRADGRVFGCACTRKEMADSMLARDGTRRYPGTCRTGLAPGRAARAWRLRVEPGVVAFDDAVQGHVEEDLAADVGDFVLLRADGLFAYQLAVTVDDEFQAISDIVRGADLLASTPRQCWLQACLDFAQPRYAHLPVASNAAGEKLSKQTRAAALNVADAPATLARALRFLGQVVPDEVTGAPLTELWSWAKANWSFAALPRQAAIPADSV